LGIRDFEIKNNINPALSNNKQLLNNIIKLDLSNNKFGDPGAKALSFSLKDMPNILSVNL